jgi:YesN/AraC family two-component response regulator
MFDALFNKAETLFNRESMKSFITKMADDRIAVVSSFKTSDVNENYFMLLMSAEQLKNEMNSNFNEKITIAIGGAYEQFKNIPLSYREAEYVLEYKFIMGTNSIICIEDIRPNDSGDVIQITNRISQIKNKKIDSIRQEIIDIFEIIKEKHLQPETARQLAMQIIFSLFQIIDNMEEKITQKEREDFTGAYYVLEKKETLAEIEQYTLSLISMLEEAYKIDESSTNNDILIESFTSYIKENYTSNDMSLDCMAEKAGMSVSQFNRRFKASTGMTFLNYLICVRIEKAKELLAHTDFDYEEITREVGYIDSRSFIRMFKKMTGITAGEYRARHKK